MIYLSQRKQHYYYDKLHPHRQCFYCSSVMFLSHYIPVIDQLPAYYDHYVDDTEASIGKPGMAEKYFPRLTGRTGAHWAVHRKAIELRLSGYNVVFLENQKLSFLKSCLASGEPVIYGTNNIGKLPGGHVVVAVRTIGQDGVLTYDPFGDARTNYQNHDGEGVVYSDDLLNKHFTGRMIYARKK